MEMTHPITVVYSFDRNYALYAAVSTYSLAIHAKSELQVVWIVPANDEASVIPTVSNLALKTGLSIQLVSVPKGDYSEWKTHDQYSPAMYLRLFIADLIPMSRAIYLDADTLVLADLGALWETDLGDNFVAGVPDSTAANLSRIPRGSGDLYINSGVLLMNLDALRNDRMQEKARAIYEQYRTNLVYPDQCILNKYAEGRKQALPVGWNQMISSRDTTTPEFDEHLKQPELAIMHFASEFKPWQKWCNPHIVDFWWRYAKEAQVEGLELQEVTTLGQTWHFAAMLDRNGRFEEASYLKTDIIRRLTELLNANDKASQGEI
jgi:lipopolysaccharide biosynthesis glycosyltransferase